nr:MAG TPA: hypothetical protein [Bacteriophage sp.]
MVQLNMLNLQANVYQVILSPGLYIHRGELVEEIIPA